jgi:hypothetical protein
VKYENNKIRHLAWVLCVTGTYILKNDLKETIGIGKDFLTRTPSVQQLRERMDKWDYMKLKSFLYNKRNGL